jgi:hypothetical protein
MSIHALRSATLVGLRKLLPRILSGRMLSLVMNTSRTRGYLLIDAIATMAIILTWTAWTNLNTDEVSDSRTRTTDRACQGERKANTPTISVNVTAIRDMKTLGVYELSRPKIVIRIHASASENLFRIGCPVLLDRRLLRTTLWYRRRVSRLV